ncbi:class 3 adenylate cyclase [Algoriphagus boseongensis]|uniref:Class 3 adenylate cyclase n=1 Tax=Algoriphagus boseongensis TaxID=1442587 RepID=A0A4R6T8X0_9BACT|nr:adenylate/guanylate cyclase domain-containing protein [Algoriphagus boseongensis]TDQ18679.1 class 3 adenylate cyclase [Algoriphagus boseongensis]
MNQELLRKQAVVFFSDIVGYTRLMGKDEDSAFQLMKENLNVHQEVFAKYKGQVVKELGDGILGVFENAESALSASLEIQKSCIGHGKFQLRIGLHCGDIIFDHGDVFGDAVNQSSRIQSVGIPGCILISDSLHQQIQTNPKYSTVKLGGFELKNVEHKVELHALTNPPLSIPKRAEILQNIKYQERNPWMRWAVGALFLILIAALIWSNFYQGPTWGKEKSVAVLPFENLSNLSENDYFSEGLTGDIIFQLSEIDSIKVIPFEQVDDLKDENLPLDSLGKLFGVTTILKGSVDFIGSKIQINVRLLDISTSQNIWSETFTRESSGIVALQNNIAKEIARALNANLSAQEQFQIEKTQTTSAEAYDLYLQGKNYYFKYSLDDNQKAIKLFKKAISIDPNYALAYTGLADCYSQMPVYGYSMTWLDSSMEASDNALAIEPTLAEAYTSKGINYYYKGKNEYAQISFEKALAYKPNLSRAIGNLATIYFSKGDLVNSLRLQIKSSSLNPRAFIPYQISGWICRILGRNEDSEYYINQALEHQVNAINYEQLGYTFISEGKTSEAAQLIPLILNDGDSNAFGIAGLLSLYLQDLDSAKAYFEKSIELTEDYANDPYYVIPINLAYILNLKGEREWSNQLLDQSIELRMDYLIEGDEDFNLALDLAIAKAIRGEFKEVNKFLNLAFERGWRELFIVSQHPAFAEFRQTKEYATIVSKIEKEIANLNQQLGSTSLQRER